MKNTSKPTSACTPVRGSTGPVSHQQVSTPTPPPDTLSRGTDFQNDATNPTQPLETATSSHDSGPEKKVRHDIYYQLIVAGGKAWHKLWFRRQCERAFNRIWGER